MKGEQRPPATGEICHYLREGLGEFVVQMPQRVRVVPEEIWIPALACWVRADGFSICVCHTEPNGGYYYPSRFNRWRIRRAANAFRLLKARTERLLQRLGLTEQSA